MTHEVDITPQLRVTAEALRAAINREVGKEVVPPLDSGRVTTEVYDVHGAEVHKFDFVNDDGTPVSWWMRPSGACQVTADGFETIWRDGAIVHYARHADPQAN